MYRLYVPCSYGCCYHEGFGIKSVVFCYWKEVHVRRYFCHFTSKIRFLNLMCISCAVPSTVWILNSEISEKVKLLCACCLLEGDVHEPTVHWVCSWPFQTVILFAYHILNWDCVFEVHDLVKTDYILHTSPTPQNLTLYSDSDCSLWFVIKFNSSNKYRYNKMG